MPVNECYAVILFGDLARTDKISSLSVSISHRQRVMFQQMYTLKLFRHISKQEKLMDCTGWRLTEFELVRE